MTAHVIDSYLRLLHGHNKKAFIFETDFYQAIKDKSFDHLNAKYKDEAIIKTKKLYIPIFENSHCSLIVWNEETMQIFDPFITEAENMEESHIKQCNILKTKYFINMYKDHNKDMPNTGIEVLFPPKIPRQINPFDCGVFLLMLIKFQILQWNMDFHSDDMLRIRDMIKVELLAGVINRSKYEFIRTSLKKRKQTNSPNQLKKKPKTSENIQSGQRRFKNPDSESCWMNSCLQLILIGMDYQKDLIQNGSPLWEHLIWLHKKGCSESLNPIPIRDIIISKEKQRILEENIAPINRLFDLGMEAIFPDRNLLIDPQNSKRIGQQDCKDFFICLSQNKHHWPDVFSLFKVGSISSTACTQCNYVSHQDENTSQSIFFLFDKYILMSIPFVL